MSSLISRHLVSTLSPLLRQLVTVLLLLRYFVTLHLVRLSPRRWTCRLIESQVLPASECLASRRLRLKHAFFLPQDDPHRVGSHCDAASLFSRLRLSVLISRTARDLEDTVVSLLASASKRQRVSRDIAAAVTAARGPPNGNAGRGGGGAADVAGAALNAALRMGHEAAELGYARVVVAEGA